MTYIIAVVVVFPPNLFSCHTEKKKGRIKLRME